MDEKTVQELVQDLQGVLREDELPFFTEKELEQQLKLANYDINLAAYNCFLIKAENSSVNVSGFSAPDTSTYWLRLAQSYRPSATRIV